MGKEYFGLSSNLDLGSCSSLSLCLSFLYKFPPLTISKEHTMKHVPRLLVSVAMLILFGALAFAQEEGLKAYNNYDFLPGEKILFEDDFVSDIDGEFPAHWKLISGQGVINKIGEIPTFVLTDGNYGKIAPRIKPESYLQSAFTIEFDFYLPAEGEASNTLLFLEIAGDEERIISFEQNGDVGTGYFETDLRGTYPGNAEEFRGKWHHGALAFKNRQIKCYVDQFRVLVVPDCGFDALSVQFGGLPPVRLTKVRIAEGGGMNMLDQLYKAGKLVTHGILFDVGKATLKPASMGTINQIVKIMQQKSDLKLEIGGHTDSDGDAAMNLKLSQARADAVRTAIVEAGIDASRLTTKGYGKTKPIADNKTPEGKANNRRVEFLKK